MASFFIKPAQFSTTSASGMFFLKISTLFLLVMFGIGEISKQVKISGLMVILISLLSSYTFFQFHWLQMEMVTVGVVFLAIIMSQRIDDKFIMGCLSLICLGECAFLWLEYAGINPHLHFMNLFIETKAQVLKENTYLVNGSLGHINHSAALVALTCVSLKRRFWIIPIGTLLMFSGALPILTCAIAISFNLIHEWKYRKFIFLSIPALAAICLISPDSSFFGSNVRITLWREFINWFGFSFLGEGFGVIGDKFYHVFKGGEKFTSLHNEFLESYAIGGLVGFCGFVYLTIPCFKKNHPIFTPICIGFIFNMMGSFTLHIAPLCMIFLTCYSILIKGEKHGSIS